MGFGIVRASLIACWSDNFFFDFLVIFLSSKDDTPAYTPAARRPFWQLSSLMQQLHISGPPLGQAFQAVSMGVTIYFSR